MITHRSLYQKKRNFFYIFGWFCKTSSLPKFEYLPNKFEYLSLFFVKFEYLSQKFEYPSDCLRTHFRISSPMSHRPFGTSSIINGEILAYSIFLWMYFPGKNIESSIFLKNSWKTNTLMTLNLSLKSPFFDAFSGEEFGAYLFYICQISYTFWKKSSKCHISHLMRSTTECENVIQIFWYMTKIL